MIFLKKYKKTIAFSLAFFIISQMFFYFVTTKNAYDGNIYFNSQSAVKNWGLKSDKILFEFSDENFYVAFDNNKNIKSSRKDFGFWVRNKFDSFFENSSNEIYISTIKNIVYIYGIISEQGAEKVTVVDNLLNEAKAEIKCDFLFDLDVLCFCLKLDEKDLLLEPYLVEIVDINNCTIQSTLETNEKAFFIADKILSTRPKTNIFTNQVQKSYLKKLEFKTNERLYLVSDNDEYVLQKHKEFFEFYFYSDYVLLTKKLNIFTEQNSAHAKTKSKSYCETYKLDYTNELHQLSNS